MVRDSPAISGDMGSIPGSGRSSGEGNGYPLWYSCLETLMDRGAWRATVHGVAELNTTEHTAHTYEFGKFRLIDNPPSRKVS